MQLDGNTRGLMQKFDRPLERHLAFSEGSWGGTCWKQKNRSWAWPGQEDGCPPGCSLWG